MNKSLMKHLLAFIVFILFGCVKISAANACDFQAMSTLVTEVSNVSGALQDPHDSVSASVHLTLEHESKSFFTTNNEKAEEEVPVSVKKSINIAVLHPAVYFLAQLATSGNNTNQKWFPQRNHATYFPSNTIQILFCTFRI